MSPSPMFMSVIARKRGKSYNLSEGAATFFTTTDPDEIAICNMTSTTAILVYAENGSPNLITARSVYISGSTINLGATEEVYSSFDTLRAISVCRMADDSALCVFTQDGFSDKFARAVELNLSGSTVTANTSNTVKSYSPLSAVVKSISDTLAIVVYRYSPTSPGVFASVLTLNTSTHVVSAGTDEGLTTTGADNIDLTIYDSTYAVVAYSYTDSFSATPLTRSGTSLTAGTEISIDGSVTPNDIAVQAVNSTEAVCLYGIGGSDDDGMKTTITNNSGTITKTTPTKFENVEIENISISKIADERCMCVYYLSGSGSSTSRVMTTTSNVSTLTGIQTGVIDQFAVCTITPDVSFVANRGADSTAEVQIIYHD